MTIKTGLLKGYIVAWSEKMPLVSALERRAIAVWMFVGDMIWFFGSAADKACTQSLQMCSGRSVTAGACAPYEFIT